MWYQHNDKIFAGKDWTDETVLEHIWNVLLEYGRLA
jgi:hypothetical protein